MRIKRTFTVLESDFQKFKMLCKKMGMPYSYVLSELIKNYIGGE